MMMVNPFTRSFECCQLYESHTAYPCQQNLDTVWLARYPRPKEIGSDNGSEFKGVFKELCANMGLKPVVGNSWNPQSNSVLERIHQVLGDGLRVFDLENKQIDPNEDDPFQEYLSAVSYAIRSGYHQMHGYFPTQMVYGRDMFIDATAEVDWEAI